MYLIFRTQDKAEKALERINRNMGFPDEKGTETWAELKKAHEQDLWFFVAPDEEYMNNILFDETTKDISIFFPNTKKIWES